MTDMQQSSPEQLAALVSDVVDAAHVTDMHTHLFPPEWPALSLCGADHVLTFHYLVAEAFRGSDLPYATWRRMTLREQADWVWQRLFTQASPLSEAASGVAQIAAAFGVDLQQDGADGLRRALQDTARSDYVNRVLELAGVDHVVMTNDPFAADERRFDGEARDPRFHAALRLDTLLHDPQRACADLRGLGIDLACDLSDRDLDVIRAWLERWCDRWHPVYAAFSAADTFLYPAPDTANLILDRIILPICRERRMPLALMLGVRRQVNPQLGIAGDGVARASLDPLVNLCLAHPDNHFLATYLARENQHELVVAARKFRNLTPFGCWWFVNTDTLATEITRMRLELLGPTFIPQHSDARVLEHLLYKWPRARRMLTRALTDKYTSLAEFGWFPTHAEVERDVRKLLSDNFWSIAAKEER
jgi:hypothetical protein